MKYKLLGRSGLRVSELCLGTMTFGEDWGWGAAKEESRQIFDVFVEAGGNFIDTANRYTNGTSECYVGECIVSERERFVLATKYTLSTRDGDVNASGNQRKNLIQSLEASLKRLGTEYIDLYWLYAWDFLTPVEEIMRALDDVVRAGKVLYVGISDTPAWIVAQANTLAQLRGWTPFIGLQVEYNLVERAAERDLLPMARAFDIGVAAWAPLGGGVLSGKYNQQKQQSVVSEPKHLENSAQFSEKTSSIAEEVQKVAEEIGRTASQVALNWVRQQQGGIIPVVGARKAAQLKENVACLDFALSEEQLQRLDAVSKIELGFPHDFLVSQRESVYGGMFSSIENHRG